MAHVSVTINGRQFRMACDDGQEEHLLRLAQEVNERIDQLKGAFGEIGDTVSPSCRPLWWLTNSLKCAVS